MGAAGEEERLMEDGNNQLLERITRKASTVVYHCSKLLGTSQKCLNIHFFAEAAPPDRRHIQGRFAGG